MGKISPVIISAAVEGLVDEAVVRRLIRFVGAEPGPVYGKNGKKYLLKHLKGYNAAAHHTPWIIFVDLNHDANCAPLFRAQRLPDVAPSMCFQAAVRKVETWLLADRQRIADFLSVPVTRIPSNPEALNDFTCRWRDAQRR